MSEKKTNTEGVRVLFLHAGVTAPLAGPLDALGIARHEVFDRGDEVNVSAAWADEHADSDAFIRADDPSAPELKDLIEHELRIQRDRDFAARIQQTASADDRARIRIRNEQDRAADAAARMAALQGAAS